MYGDFTWILQRIFLFFDTEEREIIWIEMLPRR